MADVMSKEARSALMSRIRGKNTNPEISVRRHLWQAGFRFRLHGGGLPGKPDLVLPKWNAVVFVHGCFWHRHEGCVLFRLPATRREFWDDKLRRNSERDAAAITALRDMGWRVAVVWECALRVPGNRAEATIEKWLRGPARQIEVFEKDARVMKCIAR